MASKSVEINGTTYAVLGTRGDIILVHLHDNSVTPFVVWRQSPDGTCHGGDYCDSIEGAVSMFETRTPTTFADGVYEVVLPDNCGLGSFKHTETNCKFEFSQNTTSDPWGSDYPHLVWVGPDHYDADYRYARVLKTVAYVVCDEDAAGNPVEQRWPIKAHKRWLRDA